MKKEILIYQKDKEVIRFLRTFFRGRKDCSARFIKRDEKVLSRELTEKKPDALIVDSPEGLGQTKLSEVGCPIIATITSANVAQGIQSIVKHDLEFYLLSPFYREDLDHKLRLATERKNWIENLYRQGKNLKAIIELIHLVSSTLNPKEILYLTVKKLSELITVKRCSMISAGLDDRRYAYVVASFEDPKVTNMRLDLQKYPEIRQALFTKKPVIIKDAFKDPLMKEVKDIITPIGIRSIIVIPVIFRNEAIGILLLRTSRTSRTFTEREIGLCKAVAEASSNALYNAFLYNKLNKEKTKLEKLAIVDYLTGIYNIRYFYNRLEEEFSRSKRYNTPLSCLMFDIDRFKKINDTYGHRIGDVVLREFAQLIRKHTRKSDVFSRYGGEEFIMLLPHTPLHGAITEAERVRRVLKEHKFSHLKKGNGITVSIGVACSSDEKTKSPEDLIAFADDALFEAKKKGRDQIVAYPPLQ